MIEPKTLLQLSNSNPGAGSLLDSVLVIVDAQNEYVTGQVPLVGVDAALDRIAELLEAARFLQAPIIHIQHVGAAGKLFDPETDGFKFAERAAPVGAESVAKKKLPNAFVDTHLRDRIVNKGRKSILLAGFMTHMCISTTARVALDFGIRATVIADATATRDLPDPMGGPPIPAAEVQRASLAALADRFAAIAMTKDIA